MRGLQAVNIGKARWEYTSPASVLGVPVLHVAVGGSAPGGGYRPGVARGLFAFGDVAIGLVAVGGVSVAPVSLGGIAVGLVALGGIALGLVAVGAVAVGLIAVGAVAIGVNAIGAATPSVVLPATTRTPARHT